MKLEVTVPGKAATGRPRIIPGGRGMYNTKPVKEFMAQVGTAVRIAMNQSGYEFPVPAGVPIAVMLDFFIAWPKGTNKKLAATEVLHYKKPDIDNLSKPVLDGISQANLWNDDNQNAQFYAEKKWSPRGHVTEISISWSE